MGIEKETRFCVEKAKYTKCGRCINTCSGIPYARGVQKEGKQKIHRLKEDR